MKDQHKKITNYRDLSQDEIDLMNKIKAYETQVISGIVTKFPTTTLTQFNQEVSHLIRIVSSLNDRRDISDELKTESANILAFIIEELLPRIGLGEFDIDSSPVMQEMKIKTLFMWLVRSVALPTIEIIQQKRPAVIEHEQVAHIFENEDDVSWEVHVKDGISPIEIVCANPVISDDGGFTITDEATGTKVQTKMTNVSTIE